MAIKIERIDRLDRAHWIPLESAKGYQLVEPGLPKGARNLTENATFVATLREAVDLVEKGYAIRMAPPGSSRGNYISRRSLRISR